MEEYQTQYKSVIHPLLRLKKIKMNSKDFLEEDEREGETITT